MCCAKDYYPMGAYDDPRAPYNQVDPEVKPFDIEVCSTLTRKATIESDEYEGGFFIKEEKIYEPAEFTGDETKTFQEQFYTITQLLSHYVTLINKEIKKLEMQKYSLSLYPNKFTNGASEELTSIERSIAELVEYKSNAQSWAEEQIESI